MLNEEWPCEYWIRVKEDIYYRASDPNLQAVTQRLNDWCDKWERDNPEHEMKDRSISFIHSGKGEKCTYAGIRYTVKIRAEDQPKGDNK